MKKEDILQKARKEGNGEYEERIQGRIMTRSALAVVALCSFFWLAKWTPGSCPPSPPATPLLSTCGCMRG